MQSFFLGTVKYMKYDVRAFSVPFFLLQDYILRALVKNFTS